MSKPLTLGLILGILLVLGLSRDSMAQTNEQNSHPIFGIDSPSEFKRFPITNDLSSSAQPRMPAAPSSLVDWWKLTFQSFRGYNWEIYLSDAFGYNQIRLTANQTSDADPRINNGCTRLAFDSYQNGDWEIYIMNLDGSGLSQITFSTAPDWSPDWSPDSNQIAFASYRHGSSDIFTMNANGTAQTRLTTSNSYDGMPAWSPDGQKIAFVSDRLGNDNIFLMDNNGSNIQPLITLNNAYHPTWSPDGTRLGFDADVDRDGFQELWIYDFHTYELTMVYDPVGQVDAWARSWSPDGRYLAFTLIYFIYEEEEWWWTYAYLIAFDPLINYSFYLSSTGYDWHPGWVSCDVTKPTSSVILLPLVSPSPVIVKWSGNDQVSGVSSYDIQYRVGAEGLWTDWLNSTNQTSAELSERTGGETLYFRSRAIDNAANQEEWPASPDAWTTIEDLPPVTYVNSLPEFSQRFPWQYLSWSGYDPGNSGIWYYTIQMKEDAGGAWVDLYPYTTSNGSDFYEALSGKTYYFRSKAVDRANNVESWPGGDGDAYTTFYDNLLSGMIFDNRGSPVSGANLQLNPTAIGRIPSALDGGYAAYLMNDLTYLYTVQRDQYGSLPNSSVKTNSTNLQVAHDFALPPSDDIIHNGHFEDTELLNWQTSGDYISTHSSDKHHTGEGSTRVGLESMLFTQHYGIYTPEVALDASGALHVLWVNGLYGDREILYMRRDVSGQWAAPVQIGTVSYMEEYRRPKLAVEPGGIVHAIWAENSIFYTRRELDGTWSVPVQISEVDHSADYPELGIDSSGKVYVIWSDYVSSDQFYSIVYIQRELDGSWTSPVKISRPGKNSGSPAIAVQTDGVVHAIWEERTWTSEVINRNIFYANRNAQGIWSSPELISNDNEGTLFVAFFQLDAGNAVHALWTGDNGSNIYYAYRSPAGVWNAPEYIPKSESYSYPKMAVEPGGKAHLIWIEANKLYYSMRAVSGGWSTPLPVSGESGITNWYFQHIALDSNGGVLVTWTSQYDGYYLAWKTPDGQWMPGYKITNNDFHSIPLFDANDDMHLISHNNTEIHYSLVKNKSTQTLLSQSITIPETMMSPTLSFFYTLAGGSNELNTGLYVTINHNQTTKLVYSDMHDTESWKHAWVDLSAWAGEAVTINFDVRSATGRPVVWAFVDEVTLGSSFPDLWLDSQKRVDMLPGEQFQYLLKYGNQSGVLAAGTIITQTLPAELTFVSAVPAPDKILANQVVWDLGEIMASPESQGIIVTLQLASNVAYGSQRTATYEISGSFPEPELINNTGILMVWTGKHVYLPVIRR